MKVLAVEVAGQIAVAGDLLFILILTYLICSEVELAEGCSIRLRSARLQGLAWQGGPFLIQAVFLNPPLLPRRYDGEKAIRAVHPTTSGGVRAGAPAADGVHLEVPRVTPAADGVQLALILAAAIVIHLPVAGAARNQVLDHLAHRTLAATRSTQRAGV